MVLIHSAPFKAGGVGGAAGMEGGIDFVDGCLCSTFTSVFVQHREAEALVAGRHTAALTGWVQTKGGDDG